MTRRSKVRWMLCVKKIVIHVSKIRVFVMVCIGLFLARVFGVKMHMVVIIVTTLMSVGNIFL